MGKLLKGLPGSSSVKHPLALQDTQETWARSLGQEDPLEKEMATQSCILAWRIPWTEEPGSLQSMESRELNTTQQLNHQEQEHIRHHSKLKLGSEYIGLHDIVLYIDIRNKS